MFPHPYDDSKDFLQKLPFEVPNFVFGNPPFSAKLHRHIVLKAMFFTLKFQKKFILMGKLTSQNCLNDELVRIIPGRCYILAQNLRYSTPQNKANKPHWTFKSTITFIGFESENLPIMIDNDDESLYGLPVLEKKSWSMAAFVENIMEDEKFKLHFRKSTLAEKKKIFTTLNMLTTTDKLSVFIKEGQKVLQFFHKRF